MNVPTDPDDVAACTCAALRRATRAVTQQYDAALRPLGLTASQFTLLATLERTGDLPLTRLAEILAMERTTLSRNLRPLERRRLLRMVCARDRRIRKVRLTPEGVRLLEQARPLWRDAQSGLTRRLGRARWSRLVAELDHLTRLFVDA